VRLGNQAGQKSGESHGSHPRTAIPPKVALDEKLARKPSPAGMIVFGLILAAGMFYVAKHLGSDLSVEKATNMRPFIMLAGALLIALAFEFVNGFHDTANAVATVIYTHSMEPHVAVAWSGLCNFAGVLLSIGAVAFGIVSPLPVELIGGQRWWFLNGFRAVSRGDYLEPRYRVSGTPRVQLSYPNRIHQRSRNRQRIDGGEDRHQRSGLGTGCQHRQVVARLAAGWFRYGRGTLDSSQNTDYR